MTTSLTPVEAGAALLDAHRPDWYSKINVETLDIASTGHCILGQLYGSYRPGMDILNINSGAQYGFNGSTLFNSAELREQWIVQIAARKQPAPAPISMPVYESVRELVAV